MIYHMNLHLMFVKSLGKKLYIYISLAHFVSTNSSIKPLPSQRFEKRLTPSHLGTT